MASISQVQVIADLQPTIHLAKPEDTEEVLVTIANVKKKNDSPYDSIILLASSPAFLASAVTRLISA